MLKNVHVFKKNLGSVEKICNLNYSACNSSMWKTPSASLSSALISTLRVIQHGPLAPLPARVPAVVLCARSVKAGLLALFAGLRPASPALRGCAGPCGAPRVPSGCPALVSQHPVLCACTALSQILLCWPPSTRLSGPSSTPGSLPAGEGWVRCSLWNQLGQLQA